MHTEGEKRKKKKNIELHHAYRDDSAEEAIIKYAYNKHKGVNDNGLTHGHLAGVRHYFWKEICKNI